MPTFDKIITVFLNSCAHRWFALDRFVDFLQSNQVVQGTIAVAVLYFVWFQTKEEMNGLGEKRRGLLFALLVCIPAVLMARVAAFSLPYRARPIWNPGLHLRLAYGFDPSILLRWSSFPSDHAVLFFALATGVFLVSWKAGLILYTHAILVISLSRVYLGVHYPSDILAGALLGSGFACLGRWLKLRTLVLRSGVRLFDFSPGLFHACLFCLAYETASMYDDVRHAAIGALHLIRVLLYR
ncbi:MAG: phosphatase PAP2 family protein [Acidobacteriia bacterium]|nr:phosphatase PAP2 family protein [Terriglobia bacterium]